MSNSIEYKDNSKSFSKLQLQKNNSFISQNIENSISNKIDNMKYNDFELNSFIYSDALKYDKRGFFECYISLIKTKQPILFSFWPIKDYNSIIIKIDLFFLSFSIYYFINALFFDETTIHKIYEDEGIYNLIYLIPHILYSFLVSHTLITIIKYFSLSERNIYEIKQEKNYEKANDNISNVKRCLVIKYICFFTSCISFLIFLWYYLSSFGAIYQNTQVYLIKNTSISFAFSLVYPFIINLIPGILRIYSLKEPNRKCIFKIGKIIQYI